MQNDKVKIKNQPPRFYGHFSFVEMVLKSCLSVSFTICLIAMAGCVQYALAEIEFDRQPYDPIINAEILTIEVVSINNALSSEAVVEDAISCYRPYVVGEIKVLDCNYVNLNLGEDNAVSRQQLDEIINYRKCFGPTWITIVICPDMDFFSRKGFYNGMWPQDEPELIRHSIAINAKTCNKNASSIPFISSEKLTSLVILHELCHALRVPARNEHAKEGNNGHCSNPNCILYPAIDFNSSISAILHLGIPKGLCKKCQEEVFAIRNSKEQKKTL